MTKEQKIENSAPLHQKPDEPHFDDELSILKARRVVPLQHIAQMAKHKSNWSLLGSFALAVVLGAASGLISAYFKLRVVSETRVIQLAVPTSSVSEGPAASTTSEDLLPSTMSEEPFTRESFEAGIPPLEEQRPKPVTRTRVVTRPRSVTRTNKHVPLPPLTEDEELRKIRESLLMNDSQKRRVRRAVETRLFQGTNL